MGVDISQPQISYLTGCSVFAPPTSVESTAGFAVVSVDTVVESFVSFAVDPVPQAVSVSATPRAKINVYFFILVNIRKIDDITKYNKKPQRDVGV
jgi:hypothetical protein